MYSHWFYRVRLGVRYTVTGFTEFVLELGVLTLVFIVFVLELGVLSLVLPSSSWS